MVTDFVSIRAPCSNGYKRTRQVSGSGRGYGLLPRSVAIQRTFFPALVVNGQSKRLSRDTELRKSSGYWITQRARHWRRSTCPDFFVGGGSRSGHSTDPNSTPTNGLAFWRSRYHTRRIPMPLRYCAEAPLGYRVGRGRSLCARHRKRSNRGWSKRPLVN